MTTLQSKPAVNYKSISSQTMAEPTDVDSFTLKQYVNGQHVNIRQLISLYCKSSHKPYHVIS